MKKLILIGSIWLLVTACDGKQPVEAIAAVPDAQLSGNLGQVLSTIDVPGYTYIEVRNNGRNVWLAGTPVEVSAGEIISWGDAVLMKEFKSTALNRTFDELLFVVAVYKGAHEPEQGAQPAPQ